MLWWHIYLLTVLCALFLSVIFTPICRYIAIRSGFVDVPSRQAHNKHVKSTPLLGGLAVFAAWALTVSAAYFGARIMSSGVLNKSVTENLPGLFSVSEKLLVLIIGALGAFLLGLRDDRKALKAGPKFFFQFLIAAFTVSFTDIRITMFLGNPVFSWCLTVFWYLLLFSAINFFDNMDGLLIGVASIAFGLFALTAAFNGQFFVASLCAAAFGAAVGFWFFNHSPASIFLGDAGSHFLGFLLAFISSALTYYMPGVSQTPLPTLIPLFILAIPLFDTLAVVVIRLKHHKPVYVGDHNHISHRFVAMGLSRKTSVFLIHILSLTIGLSVLPVIWGDIRISLICTVQAFALLIFVSVVQYAVISEENKK